MQHRTRGRSPVCRAAAWAASIVLAGALGGEAAQAGGYLMPEVGWGAFAPRPEASEATPNLYGYGFRLSGGYSVRQALDFGAYGSYLPGTLTHAQIGKGVATLVSYGGEVGLRFADSVYLGFRGGATQYKLNHSVESPDYAGELPGAWKGPSGGFALGAVNRLSKTSFIQTTFEVMHHVLASTDGSTGKRQMDSFSLGVAFMHNGRGDGAGVENAIFKNFLDSIVFF